MGFALVSGGGLALDFYLFLALVKGGVAVFLANILSSAAAVTFVYFVSAKRVFGYVGHFLYGLFLAWIAYQVIGIIAFSALVGLLAHYVSPALAKVCVLPVTFSTNYLVMRLLTHSRLARPKGVEAE